MKENRKKNKRIEKEKKKLNRINFKKLEKSYYFRDFEIEMYWKRAQYFWSFLAVIYAGYFLLVTSDKKNNIPITYILLTASIGVLMSFAWYLVNRGSKRWQEHWENMIIKYEKYSNFIVYGESTKIDEGVIKAGKFSVSKVNIIVSLLIFISWIFILVHTINKNLNCTSIVIGLITLFLLILMLILSRSQS